MRLSQNNMESVDNIIRKSTKIARRLAKLRAVTCLILQPFLALHGDLITSHV